jgi:hypothetical protein
VVHEPVVGRVRLVAEVALERYLAHGVVHVRLASPPARPPDFLKEQRKKTKIQ